MSSGKLNSDLYLRIIACFKLVKAVLFFCAAFGVLHLMHKDVEAWLQDILNQSHVDSDNRVAKWCLRKAGTLTKTKIELLSAVAFFYGSLFATEGIGLYLRKTWAEYFVVIVTGSLLPFEIYELSVSFHWAKIALIVVNLAILVFLIYVIRAGKKSGSG